MKKTREFEIAFVGLKPGKHEFNYLIKDRFFENFTKPDFENALFDVKVIMEKKPMLFLLYFQIVGEVDTICDRCGDSFRMKIWDEFDHVIKMVNPEDVEMKNEEDPEISYISRNDSMLNIAEWIYEFIIFSVPLQKVHPDDEKGESTCNKEIIKLLNRPGLHKTNAMWDELKNKLKNN